MKSVVLVCLMASMLLFTACGNRVVKDREEKTENPSQETAENIEEITEKQPEKIIDISADNQQCWDERQKIIENWEFPDYFIVEGAHYEELYKAKGEIYVEAEEIYKIIPTEIKKPWYGIPDLFPFVVINGDLGLFESSVDSSLDEGTAICQKYFTKALGFNAPEERLFVDEQINYPHLFEGWWSETEDVRWQWLMSVEDEFFDFEPSDPFQVESAVLQPYKEPISLDVALIDEWRITSDWHTMTLEERLIDQYRQLKEIGHLEELKKAYFLLSGLTILNGDSRTEESYFAGSRAKNIRITVNGEYTKEICLADTPAPQLVSLDYVQSTITKPIHIEIEVLDSYAGTTDKIYITEVGVGIQTNDNQWLYQAQSE